MGGEREPAMTFGSYPPSPNVRGPKKYITLSDFCFPDKNCHVFPELLQYLYVFLESPENAIKIEGGILMDEEVAETRKPREVPRQAWRDDGIISR